MRTGRHLSWEVDASGEYPPPVYYYWNEEIGTVVRKIQKQFDKFRKSVRKIKEDKNRSRAKKELFGLLYGNLFGLVYEIQNSYYVLRQSECDRKMGEQLIEVVVEGLYAPWIRELFNAVLSNQDIATGVLEFAQSDEGKKKLEKMTLVISKIIEEKVKAAQDD